MAEDPKWGSTSTRPDRATGLRPRTSGLHRSILVRAPSATATLASQDVAKLCCVQPSSSAEILPGQSVLKKSVYSSNLPSQHQTPVLRQPCPGDSLLRTAWKKKGEEALITAASVRKDPAKKQLAPSSQKKTVCAVACCKPPYPPGTSTHRFPQDPEICKEWVRACKRVDKFYPDTSRICSRHFAEEDYEEDIGGALKFNHIKPNLKRTAIPTLRLHPSQA